MSHAYKRDMKLTVFELAKELRHSSQPRGLPVSEGFNIKFSYFDHHYMKNIGNDVANYGFSPFTFTPGRWESVAFAMAEGLWILKGEKSSSMPVFYAQNMQNFVNTKFDWLDGAYGYQFGNVLDDSSQWQRIRDQFKADLDTRRAIISTFRKDFDWIESKDIPCNIMWQFIVRNERLHLFVTSRSTDLMTGFFYDTAQFIWFQQMVAGWLGIQTGTYEQNIGSLHMYEKDRPILKEMDKLEELNSETDFYLPSASLPYHQFKHDFELVVKIEEAARLDKKGYYGIISDFEALTSEFYKQVACGLLIFIWTRYQMFDDAIRMLQFSYHIIRYGVGSRLYAAIPEDNLTLKLRVLDFVHNVELLDEYVKARGHEVKSRAILGPKIE